mmetsp:Transcript_74273/g.206348  ORF Transcript_74273/g.206348 Transcript_74273/m.206348 type:complete len:108 (-) Transcript_74273:99-422(-)
MPVKHIVMFGVKEDTTEEQFQSLKDGLLELPKQISSIKEYELGIDLKLESGQTHPAGKNRSVVWSATFDSVEAYEAYAVDAAHKDCIANFIAPVIEPGTRSAIQYSL